MPSTNQGNQRQGKIVLTISTAGSGNYDKDRSYHTVSLNPPVKIPACSYVSAKLVSASVWNSVPNVFSGTSDSWVISITDPTEFPLEPAFTKEYSFIISQGQYSFDDLTKTLSRIFVAAGLRVDTLTFTPDLSSGYCLFSTSYSALTVKASGRSVAGLFGLNKAADFEVPTSPAYSQAPNRAAFNTINSFILHSSIASPGLPVNGRTSSILGVVPITVKPNRLINYTPAYPIEVNADTLESSQIEQVSSYWTTEDGFTTAPMYEDFTYTVEISYS